MQKLALKACVWIARFEKLGRRGSMVSRLLKGLVFRVACTFAYLHGHNMFNRCGMGQRIMIQLVRFYDLTCTN